MFMRLALLVFLCGAAAVAASAQGAKDKKASSAAASPSLATDDEKAIYALGLSAWRSLASLDLSVAEVEIFKRAVTDAAKGRTEISLDEARPKVEVFRRARAQRVIEKEKARSAAYLEKAEAEPGAVKTASGLIYFEGQPGTGDSPTAGSSVKVHYRGTLVDGTEFDNSRKQATPPQLSLKDVIPCWREGIQKMKVGGKARLVCPSRIAYGERGRPSIPGGATLIFEVELVEIVSAALPPGHPTRPAPSPTPPPDGSP
jgi:FKBP-type peptidyl-prolyl cis-trans isomerase FkpA